MHRYFIIAIATGLLVLTVILIALVVPKRGAKELSPRRSLFSSSHPL
jgi:hypothetical protein